jgi:hypothetical protein
MNYPEPDEPFPFPPIPSPRRPRPTPQPLLTYQIRDEHFGLTLLTAHSAEEALAIFRYQQEYARDNYHGVPIDESIVYTAWLGGEYTAPTTKAPELSDLDQAELAVEETDVWNGGRGWGGAAPPGKLWADNTKSPDPDL